MKDLERHIVFKLLMQKSCMSFLKDLWALTRFEHAIMLAIAVLIGETIILGGFPPITTIIILSLLVPIFSEVGSFALNDYLDLETDKINKKTDRPLVQGALSPKFALWFSIITILLSIILAWFINVYAFVIALVFNLLAILYNWKLKDLPLLGNLYIATTMAIPFIFGNFVVSTSLSKIAIILAALGFVAGLAREIVKSVQDVKGDVKARNSKTLPVIVGEKNALYLSYVLYLIFILLTILPFFHGLKINSYGTFLIAIADAGILYNIFLLVKTRDYRVARKISLVCLFIGLIGILLSVL